MPQLISHDKAVPASFVRTPAAGPEPMNTLVYLRCPAAGVDLLGSSTEYVNFDIRFKTDFRIDGYLQSQHHWFETNTHITATAMLRKINTSTDLEFNVSVESVDPFLDTDGSVGFVVRQGGFVDDEAIMFGGGSLLVEITVSAYILCYEPRVELPPSGSPRTPWYKERYLGGERIVPKKKKIRALAQDAPKYVPGC